MGNLEEESIDYRSIGSVREQIMQASQRGQDELAFGILLTYEDIIRTSLTGYHPLGKPFIDPLEYRLRIADFDFELCGLDKEADMNHTYDHRIRWANEAITLYLEALIGYKHDLDAERVVSGRASKYRFRLGWDFIETLPSDTLTTREKRLIAEDGFKLTEKILQESRKWHNNSYDGVYDIEQRLLPYFKRRIMEYMTKESQEELEKTKNEKKSKGILGKLFGLSRRS
ncbi:MAG TPA: hypothetical protein VJJ23_04280 [Candidatus Nanoarchaeia archaeon]|nr:hypothetical protein [Candidatus Nanoarchaeia archaeon]